MMRALMTAASGMKAQQMQVDTIANNIANVNTVAFKKNELAFRDMFYQTFREPGAPTGQQRMTPTGLQVGSGAEIASSLKIFHQGEVQPTSAPYDMAIVGQGFFRVLLGSGDFRYTRDGSFRPDGNGTLVTAEGYQLDPPVRIPSDAIEVTVSEDGTVSVRKSEGGASESISNISLYRFANPTGLKAVGGNLYSETESSGKAQQQSPGSTGTGIIKQSAIERANVSVVDELVGLIMAQRNYEVNSRAIKVSDEMLQQVNNLIR
ncbi:MAG: flagellar basal-body rod protein FlgG [Planctomycetes bacterium]|nr:flagellar basal-body rod protein FlgG [Planctomycetota bacterium]